MVRRITSSASAILRLGLVAGLSGCSELHVLDPKGAVGAAEKSLIATSTCAMRDA
ncbi:ubiquinol oxidase subunit II, partial [Burkholderia pseudomallei]|nr:ubiquinol oxidase subunit II [Burkholderia pseudomallei]